MLQESNRPSKKRARKTRINSTSLDAAGVHHNFETPQSHDSMLVLTPQATRNMRSRCTSGQWPHTFLTPEVVGKAGVDCPKKSVLSDTHHTKIQHQGNLNEQALIYSLTPSGYS